MIPSAIYIDLLNQETFFTLLQNPHQIEQMIPKNFKDWIVIDEVQKFFIRRSVYRSLDKK